MRFSSALAGVSLFVVSACQSILGNDFVIATEITGGAGPTAGPGGSGADGGATTSANGGAGPGGAGAQGGGGTDCPVSAAEPVDLDIVVLVDVSGSMTQNNRWDELVADLNAYFDDAIWPRTSVALNLFPSPAGGCTESMWDPAQEPFASLASHATLELFLADFAPGGQSSMGSALLGTLSFATTHASTTQGRTVVVMTGDGPVNTCHSDAAAWGAAASAALTSEGVLTYAVALTNNVPMGDFDQVAMGGGTVSTREAYGAGDVTDFLHTLHDQAHHCAHRNATGATDPSGMVVHLDAQPLPNVATRADCNGAGWYLGTNDTERVLLCPDSCAAFAANSTVEVGYCP